jgi:predicted TIM-barrel fold metal-dependent hydrolase
MRLARAHEHFYGDTAALNMPPRSYAWKQMLADPEIRRKLVHGSDWPIISLPSPGNIGWARALRLLRQKNWMRRDVLIKRELGLEQDYWTRGATILGLAPR